MLKYRIGDAKGWLDERRDRYHGVYEVKVRKEHVCTNCGEKIKKGEIALVVIADTGDGFPFRDYYCGNCYEKKEAVRDGNNI